MLSEDIAEEAAQTSSVQMGDGLIGYEQELLPRDLECELAAAAKQGGLSSSLSCDSLDLTLKHKSSL